MMNLLAHKNSYPAWGKMGYAGLFFLLWLAAALPAQPTTLPLHADGEYLLQRMAILSGDTGAFHNELRPYLRSDAVRLALQMAAGDSSLSPLGRRDVQYLLDDNSEWAQACAAGPDSLALRPRRNKKGLLGIFYRSPASFFEVNQPAFHLRVNPMLHLAAGRQQGDPELVFTNQRGLEVRGDVDGRIFFYTNVVETQARFPNYVNQWIGDYQAVPGAGFFKKYQSEVFNIQNGYDFNLANAYIGGHLTRHVSAQFGHGRHFIGNGYRSLLLSDAGNNAFYLKLSTRIWRLHYQNLFLELTPISSAVPRPANSLIPKKYAAVHYLSLRLSRQLTVGFFEATVFNRSRQFEFQYLNPVILYRTVEGMIGSPDNVLIGFDGRWNLWQRVQAYGQVLVDEFLFSALYKADQKGWWGNKFGWQAGLKYLDAFGVDHLDLQAEVNSVRPYTYSSFDSLNSFTHYSQPLAHPLWSNFTEFVGLVRYRPLPRLSLCGRAIFAKTGDNPAGQNWGANPLLSNSIRQADYGNNIGQGLGANTTLLGLDASWTLYHNLFVDLHLLWRHKNSVDDTRDLSTQVFSLGLRLNTWTTHPDF
ncbi:MAG: hypothetical protein IT260_02545 [Saprospiraceae bacterium]|nr:hypothetical protein [Saprospiraceae bacterium]